MLFYEIEVFYHAHMVKGTIALIEGFKAAAGKILAFIAEPHKPFPKQATLFFHKSTALTTWNATTAVRFSKSFLLQIVFHRQVADTYTAVHPTRRNKLFFHMNRLQV